MFSALTCFGSQTISWVRSNLPQPSGSSGILAVATIAGAALLIAAVRSRSLPNEAQDPSLKFVHNHSYSLLWEVNELTDANQKDSKGDTPLSKVVKYAEGEIREKLIQTLIGKGADINGVDSDGNTPLIHLIKHVSDEYRYQLIELLIQRGADVNIKNKQGESPLSLSFTEDDPALTEILIKAAVDLDNEHGKILLSKALDIEDEVRCQNLIERGAQPAREDEKRLEDLLNKCGCNKHAFNLLCLKKPKVGVLEILDGFRFRPLERNDRELIESSGKPIAMINHCFYDCPVTREDSFGAVAQYYEKNSRSLYRKFADKFCVVRVRVEDKRTLGSLIKKVQFVAPNTKIQQWMIQGHGNNRALGVSKEDYFLRSDVDIMNDIAKRLDSSAIISLLGCNNAIDIVGQENIATAFSKVSGGRIVMASEFVVTDVVPVVKTSKKGKLFVIPFFLGDPKHHAGKCNTRAYLDGDLILDGWMPLSYLSKL